MRKAGDIVSALFRDRFGPDFMESAKSSAGLFSSWEKIVAEIWPADEEQKKDDVPAAAVHSRIRELEKGVLLVEADHPGWIQILQTKQAELLAVVRRRHPDLDIRAIAFRLSQASRPVPAAPAPDVAAPVPVSKAATPEAAAPETATPSPRAKTSTGDEDFYAALKRLDDSIKKRNT